MTESVRIIVPLLGVFGLLCAFFIFRRIRQLPAGEGDITDISDQIHQGAMVFMKREFKILAAFAALVGVILWFKDHYESIAFFLGALASGMAGFIGMYTATKANVRTTIAAYEDGAEKALRTAFFGGTIMGLTVASMGLLGVGGLFVFFGRTAHDIHIIHGFAMGASLVAIFFRVGGGIFTKAADVGADLVGKVESGIPEDDPRNPGVIADNVGDNVGDVAGMGSDLFESYCNAQIASMAIAATMTSDMVIKLAGDASSLMFLPLALTSTGLLCSLLGMLIVRMAASREPAKALRTGTLSASVIFIIAAFGLMKVLGVSNEVWMCVLAGSVGGTLIGLATEYYTGGRPMREIAKSSQTGVATVMISGLAVGMQSVVIPLLTVAGILLLTSHLAGLYGVGIAAVGMLSTIGITMSIDAYGPVADNAGGIAEMAGLGKKTRDIT
ncbi:MAG: sodium/proton-translocating pyrophosphatase, partial [Puniceicoccaceae bacterium]